VAPAPGTATDALSVTLNDDQLNGVTAPEQFSAQGDFQIRLSNGDSPVHVHLRFDGPLGDATEVAGTNHYLEPDDQLIVDVSVLDIDEPVGGTLGIVTGHGAVEETISVTVEPSVRDGPVEVDQRLSEPNAEADVSRSQPSDSQQADGPLAVVIPSGLDTGTVLVSTFALAVLVLAVGTQVIVGSLIVTVGLFAVIVSVAAAMWILLGQ
jgi:hypothetical protein